MITKKVPSTILAFFFLPLAHHKTFFVIGYRFFFFLTGIFFSFEFFFCEGPVWPRIQKKTPQSWMGKYRGIRLHPAQSLFSYGLASVFRFLTMADVFGRPDNLPCLARRGLQTAQI